MESGPKVSCVLLASAAFLLVSAKSFGVTHDSTDARSRQDCSKAFADPEFEDRATLGKVQDGVERLPGCGLNGSGGIRLHVAPGAKKVSYRFPSDFRPKAGRKYVFSICRKVHGNARVELYWQCWGKDGWCRKQNWNTTLVPLDGGWERQENILFLGDKEWESGETRFFAEVRPAQGAKQASTENWVDYDCLEIREDKPDWYFANVWPTHNMIYKEKGRIRLHSGFLGEFLPEGHRARYSLVLEKPGGAAIAKRAGVPRESTFTVQFGPLAYTGPAKLKTTIIDSETGKELETRSINLTVGPTYTPKKGEVFITETGDTLIDGKPFMPLGFYTSLGSSGGDLDHARRELKKISDAGFNTIMEYWITSFQGKDKIAKFYSACRANNIKVLFNFSGAYKTPDKMDEHVAMAKRQLDAGAPILAWYTLDEAPFSLLPPIRSLRHALNRFSPGIPTWQVNIREIEPYLDVADVLGGDHYLIGRRQGVLKQMNQYMALAASCRPAAMWYCPQCFNWATYDSEAMKSREKFIAKDDEPTVNEMLAIAFLHASYGTRGFIFYKYDEIFKGPVPELYEKRWEDVKTVGRVMRELEPFILAGRPIETIDVENVRGLTRAVRMTDGKGGNRILVIGLDYSNEATFRLPDGCEGLKPSFGNAEVSDGVCRFKTGRRSCELFR